MRIHNDVSQNIAAIVPCYSAHGDSTTIIACDGTATTYSVRILTMLKRLAKSRAADLAALKAHVAQTTLRSILQPLPLGPDLLLVPVKTRTPRVAHDPCTGYVNYYAVANVSCNHKDACHATITLTSGTTITALWTKATVQKQLYCARLAAATAPLPPAAGTLREQQAPYQSELTMIAHKLVEILHDIIALKQR